jgi:hypothetical protein
MTTTPQQIAAHQSAVVLAEGARQAAQAAARAAYSGLAAGWQAYDVAIRTADINFCKAVIASSVANGLGSGPRETLHRLNGQDQ